MENEKQKVLIVAPSLNVKNNVSGVSAVTNFIISHNGECEYEHFLQGRDDGERGALRRVMRVWRNYRAWKKRLKTIGDVVIHYNYPLDTPSIVRDYCFLKAAHKQGLPMVIHIHGGLYLFKDKKPFVIRKILSEVFSWENPFIVLSNKERSQLQKVYGTRNVSILPNCVDLPEVNVNRNENKDLNFLYLGRIEPNKGMDYLLEAMRMLNEEGRHFVLHLAGIEQGKNRYVERYQELLGDRFVYEGVVSGEKKVALLKRCQVFVLPSLYEGLPISLLETMSYGLVPVVTDVGSIGEYVKDGENGLLLKVKDSQSIVEAIDKLGSDGKLLQRLSKNARQTISERFNPTEYIKKLNSIYAQTFKS